MNTKSKGGRGKLAPYQSTHVRVPIPVKPVIEKIVEQYRESGVIPSLNKPVNGFSREEILTQLEDIRKSKKIGKDTINQILDVIFQEGDSGGKT